MNNTYNANLYLTPNDLDGIESTIDMLTSTIQEVVFDTTRSPLKNIQVGDNLSGKTLYLSFPTDIYESITNTTNINFITTDKNNYLRFFKTEYANYNRHDVGFEYKSHPYTFYRKRTNEDGVYINRIKYKLPYDFGVVTSIDTNNDIYQYVKIYDNENIIPNYEKHVWTDNEVPSMQKLDNIEKGVKNIGYYYYKPIGWLNTIEWLKTCSIKDYDNNTNIKSISYRDLNRWVNNLNLINFNNIEEMTIWNSSISEIDLNKQNDTDWEEY